MAKKTKVELPPPARLSETAGHAKPNGRCSVQMEHCFPVAPGEHCFPREPIYGKEEGWYTYYVRSINARIKAKVENDRRIAASTPKIQPPLNPEEITAETVIEGQTIQHWSEQGNGPGWVSWALRKWEALGKPSKADVVLAKITSLREEAEKQLAFANMDKNKAALLKEPKKGKLLAAAQKKSDKAEALFKEADEIAKKHKEASCR